MSEGRIDWLRYRLHQPCEAASLADARIRVVAIIIELYSACEGAYCIPVAISFFSTSTSSSTCIVVFYMIPTGYYLDIAMLVLHPDYQR